MRSDHLKKLKFPPNAGQDRPLKEVVKSVLEAGGYPVDGEIFFRNYHQVYAPVKGKDGKTVASAWKFAVRNKNLVIEGGREDEIPADVIAKLANPPRDMLYSLSPRSFNMNSAWRDAALKSINKANNSFSRGSFIKIDPSIGEKITENGEPLSEIIISDGQRGLGLTPDGKRVRMPRETRQFSDVYSDFPIVTAQTIKSRSDRAISVEFMAADTVVSNPKAEFSIVSTRSKPPFDRDDSSMIAIYADNQIIGCVSGVENSERMINVLKESNIRRGFTADLVLPPCADDIEINIDKLSEVVSQMSSAADYTPA